MSSDTVTAIGERVMKMLEAYKEEFSHSPETRQESEAIEKLWDRYYKMEEKLEKICDEYEI